MKKKIIFGVIFVILVGIIVFGLFKLFDKETSYNLKQVKVAEPIPT